MVARKPVPKTRNDGTMTEVAFRGWIRSSLRRMSMRWRPIYGVLSDCKRAVTPTDSEAWGKRIKFVYQCSICLDYFPRKNVEVDHIHACGSIIDIEKDLGPFVLRLLCERDGLRVLCDKCHRVITQEQRDAKS